MTATEKSEFTAEERRQIGRVRDLARERKALILAHHYQREEVKEAADATGDSYQLAVLASRAEAEIIVLAGVRFMAESAAILCPDKTVLLPAPDAGCPLADTITPEDVDALRAAHPGIPVVAYVNTSAAVKAKSDYCCTSANAPAVVRATGEAQVIFLPDRNLADWTSRQTGVGVIPWKGFCHVHHRVRAADVRALQERHPDAAFVAHPECRPDVLTLADHVASTTGIFSWVAASSARTFIIGTEEGVLGRLRRENPGKTFMTPVQDMICPNMKLTGLDDVLGVLERLDQVVTVPEEVAADARRALERMVSIA